MAGSHALRGWAWSRGSGYVRVCQVSAALSLLASPADSLASRLNDRMFMKLFMAA